MRRLPLACLSLAALAAAALPAAAASAGGGDTVGALTFAPNVKVYDGNLGEPGLAVSPDGRRVYVTTPGSTGGAGGAVLGTSTDGGLTFGPAKTVSPSAGADGTAQMGGSDSDVVVAANGDVLTGDLQLGSPQAIVVKRSTDGGVTFPQEADIATGVADREWLAVDGVDGKNVYVAWHDLGTGTMFVVVSRDKGVTFGAPQVVYSNPQTAAESAHNGTSIGQISTDGVGGVYVSYGTTLLNATDTTYGTPPITTIHMSVSSDFGATFHDVTVNPGTVDANYGNFWMASATDRKGNVYAVYSGYAHKGEQQHVWLQESKDKGATWTAPYVVDTEGVTGNALFGWVAGGDDDTAVVAWYDTTAANKDAAGISWTVPVAQVRGLLAGTPKVWRGTASDRIVHTGGICTLGTLCGIAPGSSKDRSLLDFFKVAVDPATGLAEVAYSDNGPTGVGTAKRSQVTFAKQVGGPTAFEATPATDPAAALPEAPLPLVLPLVGLGVLGAVVTSRRRRRA